MFVIPIIYFKHYLKIFSKGFLLLFPLLVLYLFYQPQLSIFRTIIVNPIYNRYPWWIFLVYYLIAFIIILFVVVVCQIIYFTYQRERTQKVARRLKRAFANIIIDYLYSDKYNEDKKCRALYKKIERFTTQKLYVEVLYTAITRVQETVTIDNSQMFKTLLVEVKLYDDIAKFLYSFNFSDRILAMRVISYLRIRDKKFEKRIAYYSNSRNFALRSEAYAALIRLMEKDHALINLIGNKHQLSMLDINVVVNAVLKNSKMDIDYQALLSSPLNRKVIVGLMLLKYRSRNDPQSLSLIMNHIGSNDPLLDRLAWDSFLSLTPKNEGVDMVINRFDNEPEDVKLLILQSFTEVNDKRYFDFLKRVILMDPLLVKIEAMKILFRDDFASFKTFMKSGNPEIERAFQEVIDLDINH